MRRVPPPLLALLLAGCAAGGAAPAPGPGGATDGAPAEADGPTSVPVAVPDEVSIEADRVRLILPETRRGEASLPAPGSAGPWEVRLGTLRVRARELYPEVTFGGDAVRVLAEGIVRVRRTTGRLGTDEGPFRSVIWSDGRMLAR